MAYTLPAVSYGNGKINGTHGCETEPPKLPPAPSMAPLALSEARVSQVEAEQRLALCRVRRYPVLRSDCPTLKRSLLAFSETPVGMIVRATTKARRFFEKNFSLR